ncbi:MAG TPA: ATP-binding cassette domain-containing protein, partial [Microthrixaceae bacterium]|nr:ATP-binding cassette domain-containing protein [Microthrixaceae bacterium]
MSRRASLQARSLSLSLGDSTILDKVDLSLSPGWRIGLVGPNGVGKSTLLKALVGATPVDDGAVTAMPPHAIIGYLPQEPERSANETVLDF